MDHPIVHVELSSRDREESGAFYHALFGWEITHLPELDYSTFEPQSGPAGGFNPLSADYPAGTVLLYVQSDDIATDLQRVEELGGKILVPKTEISKVGWFGIFSDPTGNQVALFTGLSQGRMAQPAQ